MQLVRKSIHYDNTITYTSRSPMPASPELFGVGVNTVVLPIAIASAFALCYINQPTVSPSTFTEAEKKSIVLHKTNPKSFGGPFGASLMPVFLPAICYWLYYSCNADNLIAMVPGNPNFFKYNVNPFAHGITAFLESIWDTNVFCVYCAWIVFHCILYLIVPGEIAFGLPLPKPYEKVRLPYRINALKCHIISIVTAFGLVYADILPATYGYDNFVQLLTSSIIVSFSLSIGLYLYALTIASKEQQLAHPLNLFAHEGSSGNFFYDFWMGKIQNPRIGFLDIKYVSELRPGLILWSLLNFSNAAAQYRDLGYISWSMIFVCAFQAYYTIDSHLNEKCILSTLDIKFEPMGFMLGFGSLTWVPFTYTTQTRFLVNYDPKLEWYWLCAIIALQFVGLYIFRSANCEKDAFKANPDGPENKHLEFIQTKTGTKLICSSWWGSSRHINYFGDWMMALAWSLPCGLSLIAYFYPIYFAALLIGRQQRDDEACHLKYGEAWERYCKRVPYKIIPYVY